MHATLERYMTRHPHSIRVDETIATAEQLMRSHHVRHLPVLDGGDLVGVLSERDVRLAATLPVRALKVSDVYVEEPYAVDIDTSVVQVASTMAKKKLGSTIILENGKLAGIFTATDACRALADVLADTEAAGSDRA
jgi:acetoin utilization protein AcuB